MTEQTYTPELGQYAFGQAWQNYDVPDYLEDALTVLSDWFYNHRWVDTDKSHHDKDIIHKRYSASPFGNYGAHFKNDVFEVESYSWNDKYEQPYNFKWVASPSLEVSWYKWLGRGMSCNRVPTYQEVTQMLHECLQSLIDSSREEATS